MQRWRPHERQVMAAQAVYFLVTGLWPLLHYRSFEAVTGRKRDVWLVKTLGAFIVPVGLALLVGTRREPGRESGRESACRMETRVLAAGSALALGGADVVYVTRGRIPRVYLADAAAEGILLAGLLLARRSTNRVEELDPDLRR